MNGWLEYILVAGAVCGFLNTLASSGSAVSLPLLIMLGMDPETANATTPSSRSGLLRGRSVLRACRVPWSIALRVAVPATLGSVLGAFFADVIPPRSLRLAITAAILVALILRFTKVNRTFDEPRPFTPKEPMI
jgi:hypothetical protein